MGFKTESTRETKCLAFVLFVVAGFTITAGMIGWFISNLAGSSVVCVICSLPGYESMLKVRSPLDRLREAKDSLPLGHYDRKAAERAVQNEYAACKEQERAFLKQIPHNARFIGKEQVCWLVWAICNELGFAAPKMLYFGSSECEYPVYAMYVYRTRSIHFRCRPPVSTTTATHELSHHIQALDNSISFDTHGSNFYFVERLCFEVAISLFNKNLERF